MAQRVTLRKRQPYNTTSNRRRIVKTPGGKTVYHHIKKLATAPKCGDCELKLPGVSSIFLRPSMGLARRLFDTDFVVSVLDPCTSSSSICYYLQTPKDRSTGIRWKSMRCLRPRAVRLGTRSFPFNISLSLSYLINLCLSESCVHSLWRKQRL